MANKYQRKCLTSLIIVLQNKTKIQMFVFQIDKRKNSKSHWCHGIRKSQTLWEENINFYSLSRSHFQVLNQEPKNISFVLVLPETYSKVIMRDTKIYV